MLLLLQLLGLLLGLLLLLLLLLLLRCCFAAGKACRWLLQETRSPQYQHTLPQRTCTTTES